MHQNGGENKKGVEGCNTSDFEKYNKKDFPVNVYTSNLVKFQDSSLIRS